MCCDGEIFDGYATRSATSPLDSSFRMVYNISSQQRMDYEVPLFRVHNTHLHSASFRRDNSSYATQLSRTRGRTHTKCQYPWRAFMSDPATSPQPHIPACAYRRCQHHPTIWHHQAIRTARCTIGPASPSRQVRVCRIFRWVVRCVPELRAGAISRDHSSRRGGTVVWPVLHHQQASVRYVPAERTVDWLGACDSPRLLLVVGLVADLTGNIRYAFLLLMFML